MAIDRLQAKLQNQNLDPNRRARIENRMAFEQRGGAGMQASQNRQAPPMQPQQPQPMQRPQGQMPQQMPQQSPFNPMYQPQGQMPQGARPNFASQVTPEMANRFATNQNQGQMRPMPYMPQGQTYQGVEQIQRYSPEESIAMRQQMQNRPQGGYEYQNPFPQQSPQMMPYNFKGNGSGLL
jgi:hypothetical protein